MSGDLTGEAIAAREPIDPRVRRLLTVAGVALLSFAILYLLAIRTDLGQRADEAALTGSRDAPTSARDAAGHLLGVVSIGSLLAAVAVLSGLAYLRRRPGLLLVPVAVVGASVIAAEILKHFLLTRPGLVLDPAISGNSFPSGHTTVAVSIGLAAVLISPPRLRFAVGCGAAVLSAIAGVFVVTAEWHRPSDPIGSFLLSLAVASVAMATLTVWRPALATRVHEIGPERDGGARRLELAAMLGGVAVFGGSLVLASLRYGPDVDWNRFHAAFLLSAAAIVVAAGVTVATLLRALEVRRPSRRGGLG